MKRIFLTVITIFILLIVSNPLNAQLSVGAGLGYGSDIEEVGIDLRANYYFNQKFGAGTSFLYYLDGVEGISIRELNLNGHYLYLSNDRFSAYGLVGLNFFTIKLSNAIFGDNNKASETGLNIGSGGFYWLNDKFGLHGEARYVLGDASQLVLQIGATYMVGGGKK
jgi:hypothetical protein